MVGSTRPSSSRLFARSPPVRRRTPPRLSGPAPTLFSGRRGRRAVPSRSPSDARAVSSGYRRSPERIPAQSRADTGAAQSGYRRSPERIPAQSRADAGSVLSGLAQQRRGRLLEDLPPGAGLLALGLEVLDHLAHPGGRDLHPVAGTDPLEARIVVGELERHRLEA